MIQTKAPAVGGGSPPSSSGSRANYAHFYGLDPKDVPRGDYEHAKGNFKA